MKTTLALIILSMMLSACAKDGGAPTVSNNSGSGITQPPGNNQQPTQAAPMCGYISSCFAFCQRTIPNQNNPDWSLCMRSPANQLPFQGYTYVPGAN